MCKTKTRRFTDGGMSLIELLRNGTQSEPRADSGLVRRSRGFYLQLQSNLY